MMRKLMMITVTALFSVTSAGISVSDIQVFSGHPWKEIVVGYTITGTDDNVDFIRLTATDKAAHKTYVVESGSSELKGAELSEGRHLLRWNAATQGVKFSSTNVEFVVSLVAYGGVQLWENGPYWAECNVGATKPEEYGHYFRWGETKGYKRNESNNGWVSVKDGSSFSFSYENCPTFQDISDLQRAGYIGSTCNLIASHDAATTHLGMPWRMPTDAEFSALINNCTITRTVRNGVSGWLVTGKGRYASKSIFLPAAGYGSGSSLCDEGSRGFWRSSTPDSGLNLYAWSLCFFSANLSGPLKQISSYYGRRDYGQTVRPLRGSTK